MRWASGRVLLAVGLCLAVGAGVLFAFPPWRWGWYPQCPVWTYLHLRCPGCGTTRAFAALLHGRLVEALRWNALTVCAVPLSLLWVGLEGGCRRAGGEMFLATLRKAGVVGGLVVAVTFMVVRNL